MAPPNTEAAFLFAGNSCSVSQFGPDFRDHCNWWQQVKHLHFERSNSEILLVTEAWASNRWAFEYRSRDLPTGASYVLNTKQDGYYDTQISDLQLLHNSRSTIARAAPWGNMEQYTIVYQHVRVQKSKLGFVGNWLCRFQRLKLYPTFQRIPS